MTVVTSAAKISAAIVFHVAWQMDILASFGNKQRIDYTFIFDRFEAALAAAREK